MFAPSAPPPPAPRSAAAFVWGVFALGLALSLLFWARQTIGGDQLNLLARGWLLAVEGTWVPYGNPMSTGGATPGGLTSLLVGLPLMLWRDYRAPGVVILLCHALAFLVLDRALRPLLSARERALFAVLYWLNPWRVFFSGYLWNPNYLYLFGAVHLATALRLRPRALPAGPAGPAIEAAAGPAGAPALASFVHAACLALAFEVHASFLLLVVASALLLWRGYVKLHGPAALAGAVAGSLPLIPWVVAVVLHPQIATGNRGFLGRGLLLVFPVLRGILYLLRYASLTVAGKMDPFDFTTSLGDVADRWLRPALGGVTEVLGPVTILAPLLAWLWLRRRHGGRVLRPLPAAASERDWLGGYLLWSLLAAVIVFGLSPTTIMYWQGLILFHVAVLPVVLWLGSLREGRRAVWAGRGVAAYAALALFVLFGMAFGSPYYRCGGREPLRLPLRYDHPMLHDLGVLAACPMPTNDPHGWWPDVLPKPPLPAGTARLQPPPTVP